MTTTFGEQKKPAAKSEQQLNSTVAGFANRIKRRLQERSSQQEEAARETSARHARILQAMTTARKTLQEVTRVALIERFLLSLDVSEIDGWPSITLNLEDSLAPDTHLLSLVASAHDRDQNGVISIRLNNETPLAALYMSNPADLDRLPLVLKKVTREFLDLVTTEILHAKAPEDTLEHQTKRLDGDFTFQEKPPGPEGLSGDIFLDDNLISYSNLVEIEE